MSKKEETESLLAPWESPNWLSRASFHWMTAVMRKKNVVLEDMLPVAQKHRFVPPFCSQHSLKAFFLLSSSFKVTAARWGDTQTFPVFLRVFFKHIVASIAGAACVFALQFFIVMFLFAQLATFLSDPTMLVGWGWILICVMFVSNILQNFLFASIWVQNIHFGIMAKAGFASRCATKATRLKTGDEGLVLNLLSNDAERMFEMGNFFLWMVSAPLQVITSCSLICALLGVAGLPSFAVVAAIVFTQQRNGTLVGNIRKTAFPFTDKVLLFCSSCFFLFCFMLTFFLLQ